MRQAADALGGVLRGFVATRLYRGEDSLPKTTLMATRCQP